jgi:hypothetical protein
MTRSPIHVLPIHKPDVRNRYEGAVISTVSKGQGWERMLSPFLLGPCALYDGYHSRTMENAWQYSKVYEEHIDPRSKEILPTYWHWARAGWLNPEAVRYPKGKGRAPEFSLWKNRRLKYIAARKAIYAPLYIKAVRETDAYKSLRTMYEHGHRLILLDYDAYDHIAEKMTLNDVLNNPARKMGHAFVLAMLLQSDPCLDTLEL